VKTNRQGIRDLSPPKNGRAQKQHQFEPAKRWFVDENVAGLVGTEKIHRCIHCGHEVEDRFLAREKAHFTPCRDNQPS
jgi:hypothetical protein